MKLEEFVRLPRVEQDQIIKEVMKEIVSEPEFRKMIVTAVKENSVKGSV